MPESVQTIEADKLCHLTGLTDRRHRQLAKEGYFPPPLRGKYQLIRTLQGLFRYYREVQVKRTGRFEEERVGKMAADRRTAEVNLEKLLGALIETDTVYKAWETIISGAKQKFLALPNKIESQYGNNPKLRKILEREVDELCSDLSKPPDYDQPEGAKEDTTDDG
jgi:hypothetical protein